MEIFSFKIANGNNENKMPKVLQQLLLIALFFGVVVVYSAIFKSCFLISFCNRVRIG